MINEKPQNYTSQPSATDSSAPDVKIQPQDPVIKPTAIPLAPDPTLTSYITHGVPEASIPATPDSTLNSVVEETFQLQDISTSEPIINEDSK